MSLNLDQERIFNQLKEFVFGNNNNNESKDKDTKDKDTKDKDTKSVKHNFYLLTGLAGTGKTFLMTYFLSLPELTDKKIAVTGCTNKAVGVLESSFQKHLTPNIKSFNNNLHFLTIHKLLQIKRKIDLNGQEIFESIIDENNIKIKAKSIFYYDLIIIDEVSMLNKEMTLQLLRIKNKIKGKVIFLGDKGQLPPVRESESHIFELAETSIPQGSLTKIMRSGNQIINFVNSIRLLIDDPSHKVPFKKLASTFDNKESSESRITLFRNQDEWIQKYLNKNDETEQIILCYTNKRVDNLNKIIRKVLYKTDKLDYVNGEKIIFNNSYNLVNNQFKYDSSQMVKIKTSEMDMILIRKFNLYDLFNGRFPISIMNHGSDSLKKKFKIPDLSSEAYTIENTVFKLSDNSCNMCYDNIDPTKNKEQLNQLEIEKCGHRFCPQCYEYWDIKSNRINHMKCPLCMVKINNDNNNNDNDNSNIEYGNIIIESDLKLSILFNDLRNKYKNSKYAIWLIMLENNDLLYVIHPKDKEKYNNDIDDIKLTIREINSHISSKYNSKLAINVFWQKIVQQLWEFYYYFFIDYFAQINYGNAITTHRSQGSTYKRVYVDLIDIINCNDVKKEGFQCLYTAVTRASENLDLLF